MTQFKSSLLKGMAFMAVVGAAASASALTVTSSGVGGAPDVAGVSRVNFDDLTPGAPPLDPTVYNPAGLAGSVSSVDFYESVLRALAGRGIMVANLAGEGADRVEHLAMIGEVFDDRVLSLSLPDGNDIVLAFKNPAFAPRWREIANQAKALRARTGLDFPKFAQRLERNSRLRYL